jgi:hypothetical protein
MTKTRKRFIALLAIVLFVVAGYLSNAVTAGACRRHTRAWIEEQLSTSTWPQRHGGASGTSFYFPYVAAVEYSFAASNTGGEWGRRHYLCLFGFALPIGRTVDMES